MKDQPVTGFLYPALFAALTAVGSFIAIPLPGNPLPIVMQNFFVILAGLALGGGSGALAVLLYLAIGALGFPVFAGATGGLAHFFGPTGGFLLSYPLAALAAGLISGRGEPKLPRCLVAAFAAAAVVYLFGVPWLKLRLGVDWYKAFVLGLLPFIPGDLLKVAAAAALCVPVRRLLRRERDGREEGGLT